MVCLLLWFGPVAAQVWSLEAVRQISTFAKRVFLYSKGELQKCTVTLFCVFMSIFLRSKMAARRLEAAVPTYELQASGTLFLFFKLGASQ